jgi:uncharacterized protein YutE (UPF0331/DUF86 family)
VELTSALIGALHVNDVDVVILNDAPPLLARLPGFCNVVVHEYVNLDLDRAVEALRQLEPVETFARIVGEIESR